MKLRNKKTGKIYEMQVHHIAGKCYESLAEINEDYEDYEEPKDFWYIDDFAIMCGTEGEYTAPDLGSFTKKDIGKLKQIGNYFETEEEAEKAIEKLKAWKRLKDKEFSLCGWEDSNGEINTIYFSIPENKWETDTCDDLDICFRGEE